MWRDTGRRYTKGGAVMAWNPSPDVQVCRDAAKRLGELNKCEVLQCVVLFVTDDDRLGYVSYGKNSELCADTKKLGDKMYAVALEHLS